jgi:TRAP-type uncharacterized transport system substrate-binding protein
MAVRDILRHNWPAITIAVTGAAIAIAALVLLRGMPPSVIVMATGSEGSDYQAAAERYRAALASAGVEVRLKPSAGALENRDLLFDPRSGVSVALIAGGSLSAGDASQLESLGTMFYEPLWLFHKADPRDVIRDGQRGRLTRDDLHGRKISIGPEGSATRALSLKLLERNRIEPQEVELLPLPPQAAGEKLLAGDIDVAVMLSSWDAPIVQKLLGDERVVLATFARADAYVALYPFLNKVTVPRGVGDLAKDLPPTDVVLFAPKASLVVRKDLHPAIQYLLLEAAAQIHSGPGVFHRANEFPAAEVVAEQRSATLLQIRPAIPAQLSPVLDGVTGRQARHPAHPDPGRALSDDAISPSPLRLDHAIEGITHVRGAAAAGGRDDCRSKFRPRHARHDHAARPPRVPGQPAAGTGRLREHAVHVAKSYRPGARRLEQTRGEGGGMRNCKDANGE